MRELVLTVRLVVGLAAVAVTSSCYEAQTYIPLPPTVPKLRLPRNDAYEGSTITGALRPRFVWQPSEVAAGTITYELQYSTDSKFEAVVSTIQTEDTTYQPDSNLQVSTVPPVGRRYYWRVRACIPRSCSEYSSTWWVNLGRSKKDFNGDGYADVAVGAPYAVQSNDYIGKVYVYLGTPGILLDPTPDRVFAGGTAFDNFGISLASSGDLNGDGYSDLIVGASGADGVASRSGRVFVYFGGQGEIFDVAADFSFLGQNIYDKFGASVSSSGDLNGDGYSDLVVGAPFVDSGGIDSGRAYVYFGGSTLQANPAGTLDGKRDNEQVSIRVEIVGDIDGDGLSEVVVDDDIVRREGTNPRCRAQLVWGAPGATFKGTEDSRVTSDASEECALLAAGGGDINGDGRADLLLGFNSNGSRVDGHVGLLFGAEARSTDVRVATGSIGYPILSATSAGDINGDNVDDLLLGEAYSAAVVLGRPDDGSNWSVVDPTTRLAGRTGDTFGASVASAGDLNGDGYDDILVGSPYDPTRSARVYVYYGNPGGSLEATPDGILEPGVANSYFGQSLGL
jgi:FG-GAP repeat